MLSCICENLATIIISIALLAVVVLIAIKLIKDKRAGKSSCGGSCGHCPMNGSCHNSKN